MRQIPVSEPCVGHLEIEYALKAIQSGFISGTRGEFIDEFEKSFAHYCGVKYAISCSSGTAALQLAVRASGIGKGDEVIVPTFTNIASVLCVIYSGAKPVLIDARRDTWCMDENGLGERLTKNTKGIIPVHIYGHPVNMEPVMRMAKEHNLVVIEDAAEAHGALFRNRKVGSIGNMGCFSFYANKIVTTGEGGMVTTDDDELADKLRSLRNLCFGDTKRYLHEDLGYNFRLSNVLAAIGVAQLKNISNFIEKKRTIAHWYNSILSDEANISLPTEKPWAKNVYWMYGILIKKKSKTTKEVMMKHLEQRGVETRSFFLPMHQQSALQSRGFFADESLPVAEDISKRGLYLPSGVTLTKSDVTAVCDALKEVA